MGCPDWHTAMYSHWLERLECIYCSGRAEVSGHELADRWASTADIRADLQLGRAKLHRGFRNFQNMDRPGHHDIGHLKEKGGWGHMQKSHQTW